MNTSHTEQQSLHISQDKLLAFVTAMTGGSSGREDDENPLPPGPWDPVIRAALERIEVFGPHPEPWRVFLGHPVPWVMRQSVFGPRPDLSWRLVLASLLAKHPEIFDVLGGGRRLGDEVALNPQPLPPRFAFLVAVAQAVISRAELLQEIADATSREGEQQGIIIVGGYIARFTDEFCPDYRPRWPFPGPPPPWFTNELGGFDLMVIASQFEQAAKEAFSLDLRQNFAAAATKLVEAGISKMQ